MSLPSYSLLDLREQTNPTVLDAFIALYERTFADPSIREDSAQWNDRLRNNYLSPQPRTHIVVAVSQERNNPSSTVLGGVVFEFYRHSNCGLLTYLAVEPVFRQHGLGKELVTLAINILNADARHHGVSLKAVFAESENTGEVSENSNAISRRDRLTVLARLGALWIDIPYVQPSLEGGAGRCRHLYLLAFPLPGQSSRKINGTVVHDFLFEFYQALGVEDPEADIDFALSSQKIGATVPLKAIPIV
jgi:hypothetical protein